MLRYIKLTYYSLIKSYRSKAIKNKTVSIISNNCWGGFMYQSCKLQYNSPFIGLFLFAPDYIKLLKNLEENLKRKFIYINREQSKYKNCIEKDYIIGVLEGTDIEFIFKHYNSIQEIETKWNRRLKRLDFNNMIVKFSDSDLCTPELIKEFENLPFKNKVCFTAMPFPQYKTVKFMREHSKRGHVINEWATSYKYYNFVKESNKLL